MSPLLKLASYLVGTYLVIGIAVYAFANLFTRDLKDKDGN